MPLSFLIVMYVKYIVSNKTDIKSRFELFCGRVRLERHLDRHLKENEPGGGGEKVKMLEHDNLTCVFSQTDTRKMDETVFDASEVGKTTLEGSEANNSMTSSRLVVIIFPHLLHSDVKLTRLAYKLVRSSKSGPELYPFWVDFAYLACLQQVSTPYH